MREDPATIPISQENLITSALKAPPQQFTLRVCLVHFVKTCKDVNKAFEVLNEVYLQNFLHR